MLRCSYVETNFTLPSTFSCSFFSWSVQVFTFSFGTNFLRFLTKNLTSTSKFTKLQAIFHIYPKTRVWINPSAQLSSHAIRFAAILPRGFFFGNRLKPLEWLVFIKEKRKTPGLELVTTRSGMGDQHKNTEKGRKRLLQEASLHT